MRQPTEIKVLLSDLWPPTRLPLSATHLARWMASMHRWVVQVVFHFFFFFEKTISSFVALILFFLFFLTKQIDKYSSSRFTSYSEWNCGLKKQKSKYALHIIICTYCINRGRSRSSSYKMHISCELSRTLFFSIHIPYVFIHHFDASSDNVSRHY